MQLMYLVADSARPHWNYNTDRIYIREKIIKVLHGRFVHPDLHILGCELHQNVFGGRAPPDPMGLGPLGPGPLG